MKQLPSFDNARVLVVGDVMLDRYWFGDVERISPEAPVAVLKVGRVEERPGGAANVARNVAALGAQCTLLSVVGDDEAGNCLEKLLMNKKMCAPCFTATPAFLPLSNCALSHASSNYCVLKR